MTHPVKSGTAEKKEGLAVFLGVWENYFLGEMKEGLHSLAQPAKQSFEYIIHHKFKKSTPLGQNFSMNSGSHQ